LEQLTKIETVGDLLAVIQQLQSAALGKKD
jgi:hypothetical protein